MPHVCMVIKCDEDIADPLNLIFCASHEVLWRAWALNKGSKQMPSGEAFQMGIADSAQDSLFNLIMEYAVEAHGPHGE